MVGCTMWSSQLNYETALLQVGGRLDSRKFLTGNKNPCNYLSPIFPRVAADNVPLVFQLCNLYERRRALLLPAHCSKLLSLLYSCVDPVKTAVNLSTQ